MAMSEAFVNHSLAFDWLGKEAVEALDSLRDFKSKQAILGPRSLSLNGR
jgi:hypothetical protein